MILVAFLLLVANILLQEKAAPGELGISLYFYNYDFGFSKRALIGSFIKSLLNGEPLRLPTLLSSLRLLHLLYGLVFIYAFFLVFLKNQKNQHCLPLLLLAVIFIGSPFFIKQVVLMNIKVDFIGGLLFLSLFVSYLVRDPSKGLFSCQLCLALAILFLSLMHEAQLLLTAPFLLLSFAFYLRLSLHFSLYRVGIALVPSALLLITIFLLLSAYKGPNVSQEQLFQHQMAAIANPEMFFGNGPLTTGAIRLEPLYRSLADNIAITMDFYRPNLANFLYGTPRYIIVFLPFLLFWGFLYRAIASANTGLIISLWCLALVVNHTLLSVIAIDTMRWIANAMLYLMFLPLLLAGYSHEIRGYLVSFLANHWRWTAFLALYSLILQPVGVVFPNTFYGF